MNSTNTKGVSRRNFLSLSLLAIAATATTTVTAAGCGKAIKADSVEPAAEQPAPTLPGVTVPFAASSLTVTVRAVGGFRMWGSETSSPPMFHIHEQHLYRPDDTATDGYPGPVIWPMSDTPITTAQLEAMRTTLHKLHLLGSPVELGAATWVADVPDTFISIIETTATGTRTYTHQIGALDMDVPAGQLDISEAQIEARKAIAAWVQNPLQEIQSGHREIVEFTRYRITAQRQLRSELDAQFKDQEVKWNEKKWLLAKPLEGERVDCRDIEGDDVAAFADAVTGANAITYWASGSDLYQLAARGLLPGEPPCEASNAPTSVSP